MKKLISILLVVAMLACFMVVTVSAAEATVPSITATVQNGVVTVTTSNESGIAAYKYRLTFDADKVSIDPASLSGAGCLFNTNNAGQVVVTFNNPDNVASHTFTFNAAVSGTCGTYEIKIGVESMYGYVDGEQVRLEKPQAKVTLSVAHNWVAGQAVPAANCQTQGYTPYTCSICGATENRDYVNGSHVPGTAVRENEVAATCTAAGKYDKVVYCSVCNAELSRDTVTGTAAGHSYGDFTIVTAATCTQAGLKERTCSVCGDVDQQVIPTVAHTFGTTWMTNESLHWHECSVCGAHCDEDEHYFSVQRDGYFWCAVCNYKGPKIPTDIDDVPKTGDITPVVTFGAVALISMAAAAAYVVSRKFAK